MPIGKPTPQVPTQVRTVTITLTDRLAVTGPNAEPASQGATYSFVLLDQEGKRIDFPHDTGDALQHMTTAWKLKAKELIEEARAVVEAAVLT